MEEWLIFTRQALVTALSKGMPLSCPWLCLVYANKHAYASSNKQACTCQVRGKQKEEGGPVQ